MVPEIENGDFVCDIAVALINISTKKRSVFTGWGMRSIVLVIIAA